MATKPGWESKRHIWPPASRSPGARRPAIRSIRSCCCRWPRCSGVWPVGRGAAIGGMASGVAALGANFWLCRRIFGHRAAMVSTTVLAVMPIAIAYSRFAWDTSQTILATVLVLYLALPAVDREVARRGEPGKNMNLTLAGPAPTDWLPALVAFGVRSGSIRPTSLRSGCWSCRPLIATATRWSHGDPGGLGWQTGRTTAGWSRSSRGWPWNALATIGCWRRGLDLPWDCWDASLRGCSTRRKGGLFLRRLVRALLRRDDF